MEKQYLYPADILLPQASCDLHKFSVVACDQYTAEPSYWEGVKQTVGDATSALHMIFPELYLEQPDFAERIASINDTMRTYVKEERFVCHCNSLIYVERTLRNGQVRRGLVGAVDLEDYEYQPGVKCMIRATEGTVLERIPPRMKIRENALLESPHIMLLVDDPKGLVLDGLAEQPKTKVYDFPLMENSGHLRGYVLNPEQCEQVQEGLEELHRASQSSMLFAVGDGNHSLATAKACYRKVKANLPLAQALLHPARYALVELVNLHDASLEFEAIHRVVFQTDPTKLQGLLAEQFTSCDQKPEGAQWFCLVCGEKEQYYAIENPVSQLAVGNLQRFLDSYLQEHGGTVDYIHGENVVRELCQSGENVGFLLPCMGKEELFPTVEKDGALPRKTFSMGEACDKRFYLECRKIRED